MPDLAKLRALNDAYLAGALRDPAAMADDYARIVAYMQNSTAIHHGEYVRTCYLPKLLTAEVFDQLACDMRVLYGIFAKLIDAYFSNADFRALFGFDARAEALILHARRDVSLLPMARIDFFYDEATGAYTFCEFNTDGTSAMNEDRELHNAQALSAGYRAFCAAHSAHPFELFDTWVTTVCGLWRRAGGQGKPRVAIVDFLDLGTVQEFEVFRQRFLAAGYGCAVWDIRELRYDGRRLTGPDGQRIDVVYRRAVTADVLERYDDCAALIRAAQDGNVLLLGDFHTQLVHNKTIFRVLHSPKAQALLTENERAYIRAHVPLTRIFTAADMPAVAANKDAWILKPLDSYASRGVHAGVEHTEQEWRALVAATPTDGSYLLQAFTMPYVSENYGTAQDGTFRRNRYYNLTGLYLYDGVPSGIYSRVSLTPIISSQYSEKTLPTLLVEE